MIKKMLAVLLVMGVVSSSHAEERWYQGYVVFGGGMFTGLGAAGTLFGGIYSLLELAEAEDETKNFEGAHNWFFASLGVLAVGVGLLMWNSYLEKSGSGPKMKTAYAPYLSDVDLASVLAVPQFAPPEPPSYRELDFGLPKPEALRLSLSLSGSWAEAYNKTDGGWQ